VFSRPLCKFGDKRVQVCSLCILQVRLHGLELGMIDEEEPLHPVTRDILDEGVMHDCVNHPVSKEILMQLVMDLGIGPVIKIDGIVCKDLVHHLFEEVRCQFPRYLPGIDIHPFKDPFLQFFE